MLPEWPEVDAIRVLPKANPFSYLSGDRDTNSPVLQALCLLNLLKRFSSLVEHLLCSSARSCGWYRETKIFLHHSTFTWALQIKTEDALQGTFQ